MSDVATQSKSFLEVFFTQWVPILSLACLAVKGLFTLRHTIADTKNKDWDTKVKQIDLKLKEQAFAELQKKQQQDEAFPRLEYPKFQPISGSTWLFFLIITGLNAAAFLFVTYTQPLTIFNIGMLIASVVAAGLSLAIPVCMALAKQVTYSNDLHSFTALQFLYANLEVAKAQMTILGTHGALAKGQFEFVSEMLKKSADELQEGFNKIRNKLTNEQLQITDPALKEFVAKLRQGSDQFEETINKLKLALQKVDGVKVLDVEQNTDKPSKKI